MYTLLSVNSPSTSTHIILHRGPLLENLPWILSLDPGDYMALASSLRAEAVSVTLAPKTHRWDTGLCDGPMHGVDQSSFSLPLRMLQALAPLQSGFLTRFFAFQFSNLWLCAPPNFPIFYLDPTIPPPSEIIHDYMPLLLFHLFVTIPIRIPFSIFTVSLTGLASHSGGLGHWTTCGCLCVFQLSY